MTGRDDCETPVAPATQGPPRAVASGAAPSPEALPPVLTVDELAAFLRLGRKAVYAGIREGEIPAVRVGRRVLIYRDAVLEWLRSGQGRVSRHPRRQR
jgi:excisionase family DNA binding protein